MRRTLQDPERERKSMRVRLQLRETALERSASGLLVLTKEVYVYVTKYLLTINSWKDIYATSD